MYMSAFLVRTEDSKSPCCICLCVRVSLKLVKELVSFHEILYEYVFHYGLP